MHGYQIKYDASDYKNHLGNRLATLKPNSGWNAMVSKRIRGWQPNPQDT